MISPDPTRRVLLAGTLVTAGGRLPCRIIALGRRRARVVASAPVPQGLLVHLESARGGRVGGLVAGRRGRLLEVSLIDIGADARIAGRR